MLLRIKYSTHGQKSSYQQLGINLINLGSMRKKPSPLNRITTEWQSTEKTNCLNHMLGINSLWQLMLALSGTQLQREVNWLKTFTIVINFLMELWEKTLRQLTFYLHRLCSIVFTVKPYRNVLCSLQSWLYQLSRHQREKNRLIQMSWLKVIVLKMDQSHLK